MSRTSDLDEFLMMVSGQPAKRRSASTRRAPRLSKADQAAIVTAIMTQAEEVGRHIERLICALARVDAPGVAVWQDTVERHAAALETCARLGGKRGAHLLFLCDGMPFKSHADLTARFAGEPDPTT